MSKAKKKRLKLNIKFIKGKAICFKCRNIQIIQGIMILQ